MNYALDALWWKLTDPYVRNLAALLTAPPLWISGCELPVRTLLGEGGFRYLLALDRSPEPLYAALRQHQETRRLGVYAEHLLAFWLANAPHAVLLGRNTAVAAPDGQTLGAADFVATLNGTPFHIELTCKFYGCRSGRPSEMVGLNIEDTLPEKAAKLQRQLGIFDSAAGREILKRLGLEPQNVRSVSIVRGNGFSADVQTACEAPLHPDHWRGLYLENWQEYALPQQPHRYVLIPRMQLPVPARVPPEHTLPAAEIVGIESGIVAVVGQRPDGFWHETARIMKALPRDAV